MSIIKTDWTVVPSGKKESAVTKFLNELGSDGARVVGQLDDNTTFRRRLAAFARRGGIVEPASLEIAGYILGKNSFFLEDWAGQPFNAHFPAKLIRSLKFPWGKEILLSQCPLGCGKAVKDCHFGFLEPTHLNGAPLNVMRWHELLPGDKQPRMYFRDNPWYRGEEYVRIVVDNKQMALIPRLVHLGVVKNSTNKRPEDQIPLLGTTHELPLTQTETAKDFLNYIKNGEYLNGGVYARCTETTKTTSLAGYFSCVGDFVSNGLVVDNWDGHPIGSIGAGASWKFLN